MQFNKYLLQNMNIALHFVRDQKVRRDVVIFYGCNIYNVMINISGNCFQMKTKINI